MKPFTLMTDSRMDHLMKVAEDCIGLINLNVSPNAALKKLAEDSLLTDKEVELVSHAINNSRQLAQFESEASEKKDSPFVLTDAHLVNADRYGKASENSDSAEQTQDQPDAVEIDEKLQKEAAASLHDDGDYRLRPKVAFDVQALKAAFGVSEYKKMAYSSTSVIHPTQAFDVGIDEARTRAAGARDKALGLLRKVSNAFVSIYSPSFADFEKVAQVEEISPAIVDIIYNDANLGSLGVPRMVGGVKVARVYASQEIVDLVAMVKEAESYLDDAACTLAAKETLESHREQIRKSASIAGIGEELKAAPSAYTGLGEDPDSTIMDIAGESTPEGYTPNAQIPRRLSQEMKNFDTQSQLKSLMQDPYIGGYSAPEVIEAFNAARSVNPDFGEAQLTSYMRQHLATSGSVPLELQVRAGRQGGQQDKE